MRKLVLVMIMLMFSSPVLANRIDDLTKANTQIDQAIAQRQQEITRLTQRKILNLGGIRELKRVEAEKVEEVVEEEAEITE